MKFYLGTDNPAWLKRTSVPLFVSARTLRARVGLPTAAGDWILDSGGFTELTLHTKYSVSAVQYVAEVRRWRRDIGNMQYAVIQDWMCEPFMLAKTGLTVADHQRLTTASYLTLRALAPDLPWMPVIQGWVLQDYLRHIDAYAAKGVRLAEFARVGIGSVCKRQHTDEIAAVLEAVAMAGLKLHGFGVKVTGLRAGAQWLASADSMAWSFRAKMRHETCDDCAWRSHCGHCFEYANRWRLFEVLSLAGVV